VVRIVPGKPARVAGRTWTIQAASEKSIAEAQANLGYLLRVGLSGTIERYREWYRVVVTGVAWDDLDETIRRMGQAGFGEVWIR
jgi:cell division protein FtsN